MQRISHTHEHFHIHITKYDNDVNKLKLYYINGIAAAQ